MTAGLESATEFMADVASRLDGRVQLTTDGWEAYEEAVAGAFLGQVDYAQLVKAFATSEPVGIYQQVMTGEPDLNHVGTSIVERHNFTLRMGQRRYTRLSNGFSRRLMNHCASLALFLLHYNFIRPHLSLANPYPRTPAMAAGLVSGIRDLDWVVEMIDDATPPPKRPKRYSRRVEVS